MVDKLTAVSYNQVLDQQLHALSEASADPSRAWTATELDALLASHKIHVWSVPGGVNVWMPRDDTEARDTRFKDAVAGAVVPPEFVANIWVHGVNGVAYLWERPLDPDVVAAWLRDLRLDGPLFLPGYELLNGFGAGLRKATRHTVRATDTMGWLIQTPER